MNVDCAFCQIIRREMPSHIITEDENTIVFLSLENHPLVVTKQHIQNIYTLDETTGISVMKIAIRVARAVKSGLQCEGVTLIQANEAAAEQRVFHFHLHIIPRWKAVNLRTQLTDSKVTEAVKQETWTRILTSLTTTSI